MNPLDLSFRIVNSNREASEQSIENLKGDYYYVETFNLEETLFCLWFLYGLSGENDSRWLSR